MKYLLFSLLTFFAGSISNFALAPWDYIFVLLFSFPIFFLVLQDVYNEKKIKNRILSFILFGNIFLFGYFLFGLLWISSAFDYREGFSELKFISILGLPLLLSLITTPGWILTAFLWGKGLRGCFALSAGIITGEFLRGYLFSGFPWNLFGHSIGFTDLSMQVASIFGFHLSGFFVILFALAPILFFKKNTLIWGIAFSLILPVCMLYGYLRLPSEIRYLDKDFLVIQSKISQDKKLNSNEIANIAKKFLELSETNNEVDLIIWPENAIPIFLSENRDVRHILMQGIENSKNLLVGDLIIKNENDIYNSAILITEDGEIASSYDKVHLVPFGEYLPLSKYLAKFNFLKILTNDRGLSKGKSYDPIQTPLGQARVLICYEIIFPNEVIRSEIRPNYIVNLSNDAWFDNSSGPYQHFSSAKFRSVENGLPVIRSSNKGISAIIDPYGRVIKKLSLNEEGSIYSRLPEKIPETIYSRYENFIVMALLFLYFLCYRKN
tara:strand:+ start:5736 stop:7217 length:1482 start_codon:yes stop_codon:yes gene_type:complete